MRIFVLVVSKRSFMYGPKYSWPSFSRPQDRTIDFVEHDFIATGVSLWLRYCFGLSLSSAALRRGACQPKRAEGRLMPPSRPRRQKVFPCMDTSSTFHRGSTVPCQRRTIHKEQLQRKRRRPAIFCTVKKGVENNKKRISQP